MKDFYNLEKTAAIINYYLNIFFNYVQVKNERKKQFYSLH